MHKKSLKYCNWFQGTGRIKFAENIATETKGMVNATR